jgi:hypothetical protein
MKPILGALIDFNLSSEPQLELARRLVNKGIDVCHALIVAGPIVEHDIRNAPCRYSQGRAPGSLETAFDLLAGERPA